MKWLIFLGLLLLLVSPVMADQWSAVQTGGFIDTFNRANNDDVGSNWTIVTETANINISINNNTLKLEDSSASNNYEINVSLTATNLNKSHKFVEFRMIHEGSGSTPNSDTTIQNENGNIINMRHNGTDYNVFSHGGIINGTNLFTTSLNTYNNISFEMVYSQNYTVWRVDGNIIGTLRFAVNGTRLQNIEMMSFSTGTPTVRYDYFQFGEELNPINLLSPTNDTETIDTNILFSCNATDPATIYNMSLMLDGAINFTNSTVSTNGRIDHTINNIDIGSHNWSCIYTDINNVSRSTFNNTFEIKEFFAENSQTFNATTIEGSTEGFNINITYNNNTFTNIQGILHYNNTEYTGTKIGSGGTILFERSLDVPQVEASTNVSFYWEIKLTNSTGTFPSNSSSQNQTVNILGIDDCSSFSILFVNYTLRDEETKNILNATFYNSSVEVDLNVYSIGDRTKPVINFTGNYSKNNNPQICLQNDLAGSTYELDIQTRYTGDLYSSEFHHIQNSTITNSSLPLKIDLYDLLLTDSTEFLITFKDENFLPVTDAIIDIQRKYVSDGIFRSVEIPLTDSNGQAVGHFDKDNIIYTITVSKNGKLLGQFDNVAVKCQDSVIGDCNINLNALSSITDLQEFTTIGGISYNFVFNMVTRIITLTFTTTDGTSKTVLLNSTKYDRFGNQSVCSDSLTSSSGTLTCTIPNSFGNVTVLSELFVDNKLVTSQIFRIIPDSFQDVGQSNVGALVLIMMLTIPFMLISSTIGVIIGTILGLVMASMLLLLKTESIIGVGSSIMWIIIAGGIIIYKITRRDV